MVTVDSSTRLGNLAYATSLIKTLRVYGGRVAGTLDRALHALVERSTTLHVS